MATAKFKRKFSIFISFLGEKNNSNVIVNFFLSLRIGLSSSFETWILEIYEQKKAAYRGLFVYMQQCVVLVHQRFPILIALDYECIELWFFWIYDKLHNEHYAHQMFIQMYTFILLSVKLETRKEWHNLCIGIQSEQSRTHMLHKALNSRHIECLTMIAQMDHKMDFNFRCGNIRWNRFNHNKKKLKYWISLQTIAICLGDESATVGWMCT